MIRRAVILAGGRGTRLSSMVGNVPKPMTDIAGLPFLHYLFLKLKSNGIDQIVLVTSYMHDSIENYFKDDYQGIKVSYIRESEPRGTGGSVYDLVKRWNEPILLLNGDTFFDVDLQDFCAFSQDRICIASANVSDADRFGFLEVENDTILSFAEKNKSDSGWINGGIYYLPSGILDNYNLPKNFSLEKDFFENYSQELNIKVYPSQGYFIDIGTPHDYLKAQMEIPRQQFPKIDNTWTLFLDRDGVINELIPGKYVTNYSEFDWIPGSKEAIISLSKYFKRILVVTNQQGIGKGIMSAMDLERIHWTMQNELAKAGGKIDRVYYCPYLATVNPKCRKPNTGMALEAKRDFPEIEFSKSIMIGDSITDMDFGRQLDMFNIFISSDDVSKKEHIRLKQLSDILNFINL